MTTSHQAPGIRHQAPGSACRPEITTKDTKITKKEQDMAPDTGFGRPCSDAVILSETCFASCPS
jgi:hypothetical protein